MFSGSKSNKDRVCVQLFHRGALSIGEINRQQLGWRIYHWAIFVRPQDMRQIGQNASYDTSDAAEPTLDRTMDLNPNWDWRYRYRRCINPLGSGDFLVAVVIGKLPKGVTHNQINALLEQIPLPQKGQIPVQSCVTWVRRAIIKLQQAGYADQIDIDKIMSAAMTEADRVIAHGPPKEPENRFPTLLERK